MGKKGGGGGSTPTVNVPAGIQQTAASTSGLGQYASSLLNPIASMTNWAANLATGGHSTPIGTFESQASQAGPTVNFGGNNQNGWTSSFDPKTGLITYTNSRDPGQQFTEGINQHGLNDTKAFGDLPQATLQQWLSAYNQAQSGASAGGTTPGESQSSQLGPFLSKGWNAIQAEEQTAQGMSTLQQQTADFEKQAAAEGESMLQMATTGSGLFPSQQAYVDQAKQTGETNAAAELSKLGLSNSTMSGQLQEQADLAASATAGTMVQGNIQLAEGMKNIALASQTLETGEASAVASMWSDISKESVAFQQNLWNEAMSGYGALGSMLDSAAKQYGLSLTAYQSELQASESNAQIQAQQQESSASADSSSSTALLGSLGKLLGSVGGAGGAAAGVAGSGAAAGGAAGAAIGGGAAGGSGIIAGIGGALTALFCQVAQTVYGFDNPKWNKFRAWLLLRAPLWLVRLYGLHAAKVADWLSDKPVLKWCVAQAMDFVSQ